MKKKSNRWEVDYRVGQKRLRTSFGTKCEAETFLRELKLRPVDKATGFCQLKTGNLKQLVQDYKDLVSSKKSPGTQGLEHDIFKEFVEFFGDVDIQTLDLQGLETYQVHLRKRLYALTVNRHFNAIKHFLNRCVDWDYLSKSPAQRLKALKDDRQRVIRTYEPNEVMAMMKTAPPYLADIIYAAVHLGLRRKEIINLRWGAVDFANGLLHIESSDGFHPKGYRPRTIPLTDDISHFFQEKKSRALRLKPVHKDDIVFMNSVEKKICPQALTGMMRRLGGYTGIANLSLHKLRHTFCTNLVKADVSAEKVKRLAGHADLRTTERYLHAKTPELAESLNRTANIYKMGKKDG